MKCVVSGASWLLLADSCVVSQDAFSLRAASRKLGISRAVLAREIRAGRLRAARLAPRRFLILRQDVEAWLDLLAIPPSAGAEGGGSLSPTACPSEVERLRGALRRVKALTEHALGAVKSRDAQSGSSS